MSQGIFSLFPESLGMSLKAVVRKAGSSLSMFSLISFGMAGCCTSSTLSFPVTFLKSSLCMPAVLF